MISGIKAFSSPTRRRAILHRVESNFPIFHVNVRADAALSETVYERRVS